MGGAYAKPVPYEQRCRYITGICGHTMMCPQPRKQGIKYCSMHMCVEPGCGRPALAKKKVILSKGEGEENVIADKYKLVGYFPKCQCHVKSGQKTRIVQSQ